MMNQNGFDFSVQEKSCLYAVSAHNAPDKKTLNFTILVCKDILTESWEAFVAPNKR